MTKGTDIPEKARNLEKTSESHIQSRFQFIVLQDTSTCAVSKGTGSQQETGGRKPRYSEAREKSSSSIQVLDY